VEAFSGEYAVKHFNDHDELTETEASGGVKNHGVRYVLGFSLLLAIVTMSLMWIVPALSN
jgi:hypothetical protein